MTDMPRPRPLQLHKEINRHGNAVWYFREGKGPRIRIKGVYGIPEFDAAYQDALKGESPLASAKTSKGSLQWLWGLYRQATAWTELSMATRKQRENIMRGIIETSGNQPLSKITSGARQARDRPPEALHSASLR